jgi:hypothetical protein
MQTGEMIIKNTSTDNEKTKTKLHNSLSSFQETFTSGITPNDTFKGTGFIKVTEQSGRHSITS